MVRFGRRYLRRSSAATAAVWRAAERRPDPEFELWQSEAAGDDPRPAPGHLFADQGHDVVALTLTGGPLPAADANPEVRAVRIRRDSQTAADILKVRLDCLNYSGGNMEQFRYGTACELSGQRYQEFTELLLDKYRPDIVFTHWPIDVTWIVRRFAAAYGLVARGRVLYYMEAESGTDTELSPPIT